MAASLSWQGEVSMLRAIIKGGLAVAVVGAGCVLAGGAGTPGRVSAQSATNAMALHAGTAAGPTSVTTAFSTPVTISIDITQANVPYQGYVVEAEWPSGAFSFDSFNEDKPAGM